MTSSALNSRPALRAGLVLATLGVLVAGGAHAGPLDAGADFAIGGLLRFFADPENVRGLFGAAAGAVASVIAARPFGRARRGSRRAAPRASDDR